MDDVQVLSVSGRARCSFPVARVSSRRFGSYARFPCEFHVALRRGLVGSFASTEKRPQESTAQGIDCSVGASLRDGRQSLPSRPCHSAALCRHRFLLLQPRWKVLAHRRDSPILHRHGQQVLGVSHGGKRRKMRFRCVRNADHGRGHPCCTCMLLPRSASDAV